MPKRDIVAIGGSAGSGAVLKTLLAGLREDFPAAVVITTHLPSTAHSYLADMLAQAARLPVARAVDGQPVQAGQVYVAAQDRHLLLINGVMRLGAGPRENMVRPAIDPMFRSAALSYGSRVVGVVLTGLLNDGASGLHAIKERGGLAVVQHPMDAEAPDMPRAALEAVHADHVTRADEMADLIAADAPPGPPPTEDLLFEVEVAAGGGSGSETLREFAAPAALTCPDCGGVLSEVRGSRPLRFRCQIGHALTAEVLASQTDRVDEAIRIAMRVMEERHELIDRMAKDARATGRYAVAELYEARAVEYRAYAQTLRQAAIAGARALRASEEP